MDILDYAGQSAGLPHTSKLQATLAFVFAPVLCFGSWIAFRNFALLRFDADLGSPGKSFLALFLCLIAVTLFCGIGHFISLCVFSQRVVGRNILYIGLSAILNDLARVV
jgi:hypothetical protein